MKQAILIIIYFYIFNKIRNILAHKNLEVMPNTTA